MQCAQSHYTITVYRPLAPESYGRAVLLPYRSPPARGIDLARDGERHPPLGRIGGAGDALSATEPSGAGFTRKRQRSAAP